MMHIDAEARARKRLERNVSTVVLQLRTLAYRIEQEAKQNINAATEEVSDYATYGRVAGQIVHAVTWGVANINLANVIEAATEADAARHEGTNPVPCGHGCAEGANCAGQGFPA